MYIYIKCVTKCVYVNVNFNMCAKDIKRVGCWGEGGTIEGSA